MKGFGFTTFYSHVEDRYGIDMLKSIIEDADRPNTNAYTSVSTYSFRGMVALVTALTERTGKSLAVVLEDFGHACFSRRVNDVPTQLENKDLFDVLERIDYSHEHEVRTLYADAGLVLPGPKSRRPDAGAQLFHLQTFDGLATGAINGTAHRLGETIEVKYWPVGGAGPHVRPEISRTA